MARLWLPPRLWFPVLFILTTALLTFGAVVSTRAQAQTCRDVGNLTVCGDTLEEGSIGFSLRGNVKIGPKGAAAVVQVGDAAETFLGRPVSDNTRRAGFFHLNSPDPNTGTTDFLFGTVRFIRDTNTEPLIRTHYVDDPTNNDPGIIVAGRLFVDVTNRRIFLPAAGAVPLFTQKNITRNAPYLMDFVNRAGLLPFYRNGGDIGEFAQIDAEFDLNQKKFNVVMPLKLKLTDQLENQDLQLILRASWTETGTFSGTVDGFKAKLNGLSLTAKGVVLRPGEFEAATVDVERADNPGLPNLQPDKPDLVFQFQKLKYKNQKWEIGGVTAAMNDFVFGDAFRTKEQTIGILNNADGQFLQINSTLSFGAVGSSSDVPFTLRLGRQVVDGVRKPVFQAGLPNFTPSLGVMKAKLTNVVFVGDTAQNFYGITAETAELQWPAYLGGKTAAGVGGFKLGIDKDKKIKFELNNGTVATPEFENGVFKGSFSGTVGVNNDLITFTLTGNLNLKLSGNTGVGTTANMILRSGKGVVPATPPGSTPPPPTGQCKTPSGGLVACSSSSALKAYEVTLSGFNLKLGGFGLAITNAKGIDDGGFTAQSVSFSLPAGLDASSQTTTGTSTTISGLTVKGNGDVAITGGSFEIRPIKVGNFQFVGLKGKFEKLATGGYVFAAGGKLPLPGIEPGAGSAGITAEVRIKTKPDNSLDGLGVTVTFETNGPGIPIGTTGMELLKIGGSFDVSNGTASISVTMKAGTSARILSLPVAAIEGTIGLQVNPFKFTANAKLSVLIFQVASANIGVGDGFGFNGGPGATISFNVNFLFANGNANLKVGKVTVSGVTKTRVRGSATINLGLQKGQFGFGLPIQDRTLASIAFSGGQFKDSRSNPPKDKAGLLGSFFIGPVGLSVFADLGSNPKKIELVNRDKFVLSDSAQVRAAAAAGEQGYRTRLLGSNEAATLGLNAAPNALLVQDTLPVTVANQTTLVVGIEFPGTGTPTLRLGLPGGGEITPATVNNTTSFYEQASDPVSNTTTMMLILKPAAPGTYSLSIDGAPATYDFFNYEFNSPPTATINSTACTGSAAAGVTVACSAGASTGGSVNFSWAASDIDSSNAVVAVGYAPIISGELELDSLYVLADELPLGGNSLSWDLNEVPTGQYRMVVEVEDSANPPVHVVSDLIINVTDGRAPAVPAGLSAISQPGELSVRWTQNSERDLAGYEIGFGVVDPNQADSVANFVYSRIMGPKEVITGTNSIIDAKLWGLDNNTEVFYGLRAYDQVGNYSEWTPLQRGRPWALAPKSWTPTPNGTGTGVIEIAFVEPLDPASLAGALTLVDANGTAVPGEIFFTVDEANTQIVGLIFAPQGALEGAYTATLKGGEAGVKALNGATMPANYSWAFTATPLKVLLPMIWR
jgi:hypothetical protein